MAESEEELKSLLMRVKEESKKKSGFKFSIQKTKIMTSSPIALWQSEREKVEVTDFIFLGSEITVADDCSHESKRCLLFGRKARTNLDLLKKQSHHFAAKVHIVKATIFPVVTYGCESWTVKKGECQRIYAF